MSPINKLIVPFPPGGSTDFTASVLADALAERWGRPMAVESLPGDFGLRAMEALLGTPPDDGLLVGTVNTNSITPALRGNELPFDYGMVVPLTRLVDFPSVVAAPPTEEGSDLKTVLDRLQSGERLRYSTDFLGTNVDVDMLLLARASGLEPVYRSTSGALEILADLEEGRIDLCILNVATMSANRGRYRAMAVTSPQRLSAFPDTPTLGQAGFPGVGTSNWQALFVHHRMSARQGEEVHRAVSEVLSLDHVRDRFTGVSAVPSPTSAPEVFAAEIAAEMDRWRALADDILSIRQLR